MSFFKRMQYHSPIKGTVVLLVAIFGLLMLSGESYDVSLLLISVIAAQAVGVVLQIKTRRIIYHLAYMAMSWLIITLIFFMVAVVYLTKSHELKTKVFTILTLMVTVVGMGMYFFRRTSRLYASTMPYGPRGLLNWKTGIVNSDKSPPRIQKNIDKDIAKTRNLARLSPLIAGLSMLLAYFLADIAGELILGMIAIIMMVVAAAASGSTLAYLIASLRWEKIYEKHLIVKY